MNQAMKWMATAVTAGVLSSAIGCEDIKTTKPAQPAPAFMLPPSRAAAVGVLVPLDAKLNDDVAGFPGVTGADHRKTLVTVLEELPRILKLINGPDESPRFTDSLMVIGAAKETASNQSIPRDRMVAVENQALQAINTALNDLNTRYLLDKDQLPPLLDMLNTKVTTAAGTLGTMHDLDATDCFQAAAAVVQQMTNDLKSIVPDAATPPAPEVPEVPAPPVTPPASQPMPTSGPAPMPTPMPAP